MPNSNHSKIIEFPLDEELEELEPTEYELTDNDINDAVAEELNRMSKLLKTSSAKKTTGNAVLCDTAEQQYFLLISSFPVLSKEEECSLIEIIRIGDAAEEKLHKRHRKTDEELLHKQIKDREKARERIINHNLKLVVYVAKKVRTAYPTAKIDLCDIIQEGNVGLMRAIQRYDPAKGTKFATYAAYWVRLYCNIAITKQSRNIYLPVDVRAAITKINTARDTLRLKCNHEPSAEELASYTKIPYQTILMAIRYEHDTLSGEQATMKKRRDDTNSDNRPAIENIKDETCCVEDKVEQTLLGEDLSRAMSACLNPMEKNVLRLRYGWDEKRHAINGGNLSMEDVGKMYHYTRSRIQQIESSALEKLRHVQCLQPYRDESTLLLSDKKITKKSIQASFANKPGDSLKTMFG